VIVVVRGKQVSLGSHCPAVTGSVKATKKKTTVVASWKACGAGLSKVHLKAMIPSGCGTMAGSVKAKKVKAQGFQAARSSCGDGVVDQGGQEECDGGAGCPAGGVCSATCHCEAALTTTTTTLPVHVGRCTQSGTACANEAACPVHPTPQMPMQGEGCCGDGVKDTLSPTVGGPPSELCDLGAHNCAAAGLPCDSGCTADCKAVGRCTTSGAQCLTPADCGTGERCCGNGIVEASSGETCDDGNAVDGDACPHTCHIDSCAPITGSAFHASVTYAGPAGVTISGLGVFVDYPEGEVGFPTFSNAFGVSNSTTDVTYGFNAEALKLGGLPKPFMHMTFTQCQGAPTPTTADFACTVKDASDDAGNVVDPATVSCAVTIP